MSALVDTDQPQATNEGRPSPRVGEEVKSGFVYVAHSATVLGRHTTTHQQSHCQTMPTLVKRSTRAEGRREGKEESVSGPNGSLPGTIGHA